MLKLAQKGQVMVAFALVMVGFMLILIIATLDLQALAVAYNRADTTALLGAQAGGSAVCLVASAGCPSTIYNAAPGSPIFLDPTEVQNRCNAVIPPGSPPAGFRSFTLKCKPNGTTVTATVTFVPKFPLTALGFNPPTVTLARTGRPAYGCGKGTYTYQALGCS